MRTRTCPYIVIVLDCRTRFVVTHQISGCTVLNEIEHEKRLDRTRITCDKQVYSEVRRREEGGRDERERGVDGDGGGGRKGGGVKRWRRIGRRRCVRKIDKIQPFSLFFLFLFSLLFIFYFPSSFLFLLHLKAKIVFSIFSDLFF